MLKLRLTHNGLATSPQNLNPILLADLDLENAEKADKRQRNPANKQPAYVPQVNLFDSAQPGYIDLRISNRVQQSFEVGNIRQAIDEGWLLGVFFDDTTLTPPVVTNVALSGSISGTLTVTGTGFLSIAPDVSALLMRVPSIPPISFQLLQSEVIAAPYSGTFTAVEIEFVVPITSILGQLLRDPTTLLVSVYSDGVISDEFQFDWAG